MANPLEKVLYDAMEKFLAYLPNLVTGVVLIGIGWVLGWLAKRIVVQMLAVLRFDRLLRRFQWGAAFAKADVRYTFLNLVGNGVFLIVFLILLNKSLLALQLNVLSSILEHGVLFVPKLLVSTVVFGFGWLLAGWIAGAVQHALTAEEVPRATLIARFAKAVLMLFFSAMALTALDIAREIVIIGFSVLIVTLCIIAVVMATIGGKRFGVKIFEHREE